ncbi:hypothetical protein HDF19_07240 [Mucilaginibacter sp. E4BP6]|uniref:hypothetical protein n=1 Tax=Mucilaginibacter sp. E4BP6 TaxID=2723089 RepID=UPI0015CAA0C3|nr:hypothetical protein [Mucilaginibacter sp. E4BP6]NYE67398.1 hypothetical protein [Mucilaginibacter sp. E4BP6]
MFLNRRILCLLVTCLFLFICKQVHAQSELAPWGNINGIRSHGQLLEFETSLKVTGKDGRHSKATAMERQRPHYTRQGSTQTVNTNIDSLYFKETVADKWGGKIKVTVQVKSTVDTVVQSVQFCLKLPAKSYPDGKLELLKSYADSLSGSAAVTFNAEGIKLTSQQNKFSFQSNQPMPVVIKKDTANILVYFTMAQGAMKKGDSLQRTFTIKISGEVDKAPVNIVVNTDKTGSEFAGFGGNFRLQNPKFDPEVIDYCLNNMRVAWGRVEMPWRLWQPKEAHDPADTTLHPAVIKAMEMAQRLNKMGIPLIISAWFPPAWAVEGKLNLRPANGIWGNPLNSDKTQEIYKSITGYLLYLKAHYGVEPKLFSFNESDIGINVRITAQQHDELIKGLGAYFVAHGLKTKMLLGDNSDATSYQFITTALNDPAALPYIGAVSFHSWRGCTDTTLQKWANAAKQINAPLIVGEGSIDAQAWGYPQIFEESSYAIQEIELYIRLLRICQPLSILQWQLTADYSPLIGGGIFGNNEPMHPGQRFYNLKQLASTPPDLSAVPVTYSGTNIYCAALADNTKGIYTLHLVNNGSSRMISVSGLPANIKTWQLYLTNKKSNDKQTQSIDIKDGTISFKAKSESFYSLTGFKN